MGEDQSQQRTQFAIGLFDSGVGGLTVIKRLREALPSERFVYLGDTARLPYGTKSPVTILEYARQCAKFLADRKVKVIVIACNTASSVAGEILKAELSCPVVDVVSPAVKLAIETTRSGRVGVIGTNATIASNTYAHALEKLAPGCQVFSRACPLFVPLVEEGLVEGPIVDMIVASYLGSIRTSGIDTLILGCTHYPLLENAIRKFVGDKITLVDCGVAASQEVSSILESQGLRNENTTVDMFGDDFFVTDTAEQFERVATPFLGAEPLHAIKVHSLG